MVMGANAAVVLAVLVLVAAVALVVRPPSPPGLAEFAPQATRTITTAPPTQAAKFGGAGAPCVGPDPCSTTTTASPVGPTTTLAAAAAQGVPSALQCFTWPNGAVTQTSDPQSPPCVATWPGAAKGNGGATSPGVSATTIRVAYPQDTSSSSYADAASMIDFFNTHFELYGRQFELVPFPSQQATDAPTESPTQQQSDAAEAASKQVFASFDFLDNEPFAPAGPAYLDTLANKGVLTVSGGWPPPATSESAMAAHAPYEWSYYQPESAVLTAFGRWVCRQLVGRDAAHAPGYQSSKRKFALVLPTTSLMGPTPPGMDELDADLAGCGLSQIPVVYYSNSEDDSALSESFVQLKANGVTTILYYPYYFGDNPWAPQQVAQSDHYNPEWATIGWNDLVIWNTREVPNSEANLSFGVAGWNKDIALADQPWYQAYLAGGGNPSIAGEYYTGVALYRELLVLASGVQMAGPHLTPQSFGRALQTTVFPNPGAGGQPDYQAAANFSQGHELVNDFVEFWENPSFSEADAANAIEVGAGDPYGAFCYVGLGARLTGDPWPATDSFYTGGCR